MSNRNEHGRFVSGASGNPNGRPRAAAELARAARDGIEPAELVKIAVGIARNTKADARDRLAAIAWVADRGYGKPLQSVEIAAVLAQDAPQLDPTALLAQLSDAALRELMHAQSALGDGTSASEPAPGEPRPCNGGDGP